MASNITSSVVGEVLGLWHNPVVFGVRRMFYICSPEETTFGHLKDVPDYVNQAIPYFLAFVFWETIILAVQDKWDAILRINDALSSLAAGVISLFPMLFVRNIEIAAYIWVYDNYRLLSLPPNSAITWWLCMLGVDFGYYWVHRCSHEVNFMWAAHQVHHSSEDYNYTTALRQSVLQRYSSWVFYLPMALFIPPPVFLIHLQFNLIYQFWIHTQCIKSLGPLEWIINTPSHHRVHHGRNRYCIDTNYAGTLIIWDKMFGTFTPEKEDDVVVYGLVHPLKSWNPLYTQVCHWKYILQTAWQMPGFLNKLSVFVRGPGWQPGKPRTGLITDIPDVHAPQPKYDQGVPMWTNVYAIVHFALVVIGHQILMMAKSDYHVLVIFLGMMYLLWTLMNIGYLYEHKWYAPHSELLRCVTFLAIEAYLCGSDTCPQLMYIPHWIFFLSAGVCTMFFVNGYQQKKKLE